MLYSALSINENFEMNKAIQRVQGNALFPIRHLGLMEIVSDISNEPPGVVNWGVSCSLSTLPCQVSVNLKCYFKMKSQALAVKQLAFAQQNHGKYRVDPEIGKMTP